jgi:two-component system sensor histidine kinase/response regulator
MSPTRTPFNLPRNSPGSISATDRTGTVDSVHSIHIIDDDAPLGAALTAGLEVYGYQAVFSASAAEGWTAAHHHRPDLILCDINMPGKNGHRFLEDIRADPALANCQFVFMTGNAVFAHPRAGMNLGADDFLLKPFTLEELVSCVSARLRRREISLQQETSVVNELRASLHKAMPHEFFTPLNGILGYAEMLDQDWATLGPPDIREALQGILNSGQRLHRTLRNYLFTLDRLNPDSDTPFPVLSAATVTQLLESGIKAALPRHRSRRKDLTVELAAIPLSAGPQELPLMVEELVDNALNFSTPGTPVHLTARRVGNKLQLSVSDRGRGMTSQQLKAIGAFRQFERPTFEQQGLGLGLFIVRQIVRRLDGQLHIHSLPGQGTTCVVSLPAYAEPEPRGDK